MGKPCICPICKVGELVIRHGKYSDFYGCTQFPRCAYTEKINIQKSNLEQQADEFLRDHGRQDLIMK